MTPDPGNFLRWTARRKLAFLAAVEAGEIGPEEMDRLGISPDELLCWQRDFAAYGIRGLHATHRRQT
jgi:hypothetical protein